MVVFKINPKSITKEQLYGEVDAASHDWIDGILADTIRQAADSANYNLKWILLDGPVDADWVEDLNTVLDDNR